MISERERKGERGRERGKEGGKEGRREGGRGRGREGGRGRGRERGRVRGGREVACQLPLVSYCTLSFLVILKLLFLPPCDHHYITLQVFINYCIVCLGPHFQLRLFKLMIIRYYFRYGTQQDKKRLRQAHHCL